MNDQLKSELEAQISGSPVHVFMKGTPAWPQCGFSKAVCDVFNALGVEYTATNVLENLDVYRATLMEITQWPTIPQLYVDGEFVGGCDIVIEMYHQGQLQEMLGLSAPTPAE